MSDMKLNFDSMLAIERLTDALNTNANEMRDLREILKPEISRTETMRRRSNEMLEARADAEKFVRSIKL